ncbi:hypothetical protein CTAYLR_006799 [Chrysophaeum taylorii]|uniref:Uncharacterized protein n=1 Tax=Chrysophaeum taylorii TaxID=2483200 RepID=A0AAD7XKA5_9STRA|nr:hypothetical protein CTAYLR_006799 [Chrysophaeum taylorii]
MVGTTPKKCYYEVLGLGRDASEEDVRKAYKKLAVQLHPDKAQQRGDDVATANERFKELQGAYECLSDAREKAWYDAHRDEILRGGESMDDLHSTDDSEDERRGPRLKKHEVNLWPYFSASAFDGFGTSDRSFWAVYSKAFTMVEDAEVAEIGPSLERTPFGDAKSPWDDVKEFYDVFVDFTSQRTFAAYDKWKVASDLPRQVRRAADADNKRERKLAKQEYQDMVRQLALWCRKRDPRVARRAAQVKKEKADKAAKAVADKNAKRQENLLARQRWRNERADDSAFDAYEVRTGALLADLDDDDVLGSGSKRGKKGRRRQSQKKSNGPDDAGDQGGPHSDVGEPTTTSRNGDAEGALPSPKNGGEQPPIVSNGHDLGDDADDDDDIVNVFSCELCKKTFKSAKQMENHVQSKAHKKKASGRA